MIELVYRNVGVDEFRNAVRQEFGFEIDGIVGNHRTQTYWSTLMIRLFLVVSVGDVRIIGVQHMKIIVFNRKTMKAKEYVKTARELLSELGDHIDNLSPSKKPTKEHVSAARAAALKANRWVRLQKAKPKR